jgi:MoaA/NifB/PqqE/SkfB family radical SAM enzyme
MSLDLFARIRDELLDSEVREVTLSGGEPLLHPDIGQMVERLASVAPYVTLVSNGVLLTESKMDILAASGSASFALELIRCVRTNPGRPLAFSRKSSRPRR